MHCDYCMNLRRSEWLGRLGAEAFTADHVRFVTLTYDDEFLEAGKNLPASHVKKYVEKRRTKYTFKHFTVGEYGGKTGRPHWHSLQFFYGEAPAEPLDVALPFFGWGKGTSQYELPKSIAGAAAYVWDYLDKGGKGLRPSNGIGKEYLLRYARMVARNRRRLTDDKGGIRYTVPGVRTPQGRLWSYYMPPSHHWAPLLADTYLEEWEDLHGDECPDPLERINYG